MEKLIDALADDVDREAALGDGSVSAALTWSGGQLLRNGVPHRVLSGSLHYFRVHPAQWRDRMLRFIDLGLNSIDTYVPWNFHRPSENAPADFTGWRDIDAFLAIAADVGLDVILRPGPYICAEWSNGGLPAWVTARGMSLRSSDPRFLVPVAEWFDELLPRLAQHQASQGGPVVAVQVENEFGSFGDDTAYLDWIVGTLKSHGITELLYTADGPTDVMLDGGSVPGVLTTATLGSKPDEARALLRGRRPDEPFICAEFWCGWFDHWGQPHHVRDAENAATALEGIVADGGSVSIYMAHGGTNFGLWAGANHVDGELRATVTSYDSDAPISEDGRFTEKFFAMRAVLGANDTPLRSSPPRFLEPRVIAVETAADLVTALDILADPVVAASPAPTFEDLGLDSGMVRYSADVLLPDRLVMLNFERVDDRALVFLDGERVGTIAARGSLEVRGHGRSARLTVVVENLGRVNYGSRLGETKGLTGPVLVERRAIQRWTAEPIRLAEVRELELETLLNAESHSAAGRAGVFVATIDCDEALDTHLALPGFVKGMVWVNGFLLGRYWNIGPQQTLYLPGPLLTPGRNTIVILELEQSGTSIELRDRAELGPPEQYIEEF